MSDFTIVINGKDFKVEEEVMILLTTIFEERNTFQELLEYTHRLCHKSLGDYPRSDDVENAIHLHRDYKNEKPN